MDGMQPANSTLNSHNLTLPPPVYKVCGISLLPNLSKGAPGVLVIWGEWPFIFRDLGSTVNFFQGFGEQAHSFGDLGSPAKSF